MPSLRDLPALIAVLTGGGVATMVLGRGFLQVSLALAVVLALWSLRSLSWRDHVGECRTPALAFAAVLLLWLPSVPGSLDPLASMMTWARTALMAAGGGALYLILRCRPDTGDRALRALVLVGATSFAVAALYAMALYLHSDWMFAFGGVPGKLIARLKPAANSFACLAPLAALAVVRMKGRWRWAAAALMVAGVIVMWRTGSKSTLAGLMAAGVVVALIEAHRRRLFLVAAPVLVAIVAVAVKWLMNRERLYATEVPLYMPAWLVDAHRQSIWKFTFERFLEHPWVGWGINTINNAPGAGEHVPGLDAEYIPSHPHSWLMEISSETGLMGALPAVLVLGWLMIRLGRRFAADGRPESAAVLALLLGYSAAGLFNTSMWSTWWCAVMAGSMALATALAARR